MALCKAACLNIYPPSFNVSLDGVAAQLWAAKRAQMVSVLGCGNAVQAI